MSALMKTSVSIVMRGWIVLCVLICGSLTAEESKRIELENGTIVIAPVLADDERGVVVDFGGMVIRLERSHIVAVHASEQKGTQDVLIKDLYQVGRLQRADTNELVNKWGDSVVLISNGGGLGSGFFISNQGHIITNYHVVEKSTDLRVTIFVRGKTSYTKQELKKVKLIALQPMRDLALLRIDLDELKDVQIKPVVLTKDAVKVGSSIFAIGNPLGLERSVTKGIVSSRLRTMGQLRFLQTDAPINPGNSGGPLFNQRGEVVGVACAGFSFFDGLAFGIPVRDLIDFLDHRDAWLFDDTQPQNGIRYLPPPGHKIDDLAP